MTTTSFAMLTQSSHFGPSASFGTGRSTTTIVARIIIGRHTRLFRQIPQYCQFLGHDLGLRSLSPKDGIHGVHGWQFPNGFGGPGFLEFLQLRGIEMDHVIQQVRDFRLLFFFLQLDTIRHFLFHIHTLRHTRLGGGGFDGALVLGEGHLQFVQIRNRSQQSYGGQVDFDHIEWTLLGSRSGFVQDNLGFAPRIAPLSMNVFERRSLARPTIAAAHHCDKTLGLRPCHLLSLQIIETMRYRSTPVALFLGGLTPAEAFHIISRYATEGMDFVLLFLVVGTWRGLDGSQNVVDHTFGQEHATPRRMILDAFHLHGSTFVFIAVKA
mmetsp:Transcript_19939/g.41635  ORF Transcript_19939/g.41635 Transcript_19939/m.41635 type:complete len:324 (+) Transcript_19939:190-1161(+)